MNLSGSMEWEEARSEFFQETYPSDRSVSGSVNGVGITSNQSTARRTSAHSGTGNRQSGGSRHHPSITSAAAAGDIIRPPQPPASLKNASTGTLESRSSRISRQSGLLQRTPPTASTTPADAISPSGDSPNHDEATCSTGVPLSQVFAQQQIQKNPSRQNSIQSAGGGPGEYQDGGNRSSTKPRMRARVQGLEEGSDSDDGDIEVVDFTDENLATEVESWDNQKKLRDMAIPLSQKKVMRSQYEKCPKIKLSKWMTFRFGIRKCGFGICSLMASLCRKVRSWCRPLIAVDRHRGCEMFACLNLQKIMMFLCAMVSLTMLSFLILPYLVFTCNFSLDLCQQPIQEIDFQVNTKQIPPKIIKNDIKHEKPPPNIIIKNIDYNNENITEALALEAPDDVNDEIKSSISSTSLLPNSWFNETSLKWWWSAIYSSHRSSKNELKIIPFYYGFYEKGREIRYNSDFLLHLFGQHLPFIYLLVVVLCHIGVIIFFYRQLINLIKGVIAEEANETWFKSVFSSWNYNVVCKTSSLLKHRSVYRHIKQKIQLTRSLAQAKTFCTRCLIVAARCLSLLFTLIMWSSIVLAVHFATLMQIKPLDKLPIKALRSYSLEWKQVFEVSAFCLPVICVVLTKILILPLSALLETWECFPFNLKVIIYSTRLFVSRAIALFTLITTIFHLRNIGEENFGKCWEDHLCHQLIALTLLDFVADVILILFLRFPRVLLASLYRREWGCSTKLNYDPYETVIDLVIDLGLMCSGMFYCPLLPIIICSKLCFGKIKKKNLIFNFTTFLFEKILCNLKFHAFFQAMR